MTGEEILQRVNLEIDGCTIGLLPYENGLSVREGNIRYCIDLAGSPGGSYGPLTRVLLVGGYGEEKEVVPIEKAQVWTHLREVIFEKVVVMFFKTDGDGHDRRRIRGRLPGYLALKIFAQ